MNRNDIEAALRSTYAARSANDAAGTARIFAPDATFRDAGHTEFCGAARTYTGPALLPALVQLCDIFRATAWSVTSMIIEGTRAAVICDADFTYAPTGESVATELVHLWTFRDGKAVELVEFFDTAYVAHLLAKTPSQPAG